MKNFSIRFPVAEKQELRRVAKTTGLSEADLIRMCVLGHLPEIVKRLGLAVRAISAPTS